MPAYTPSLDEFTARAEPGNLVPVYREIIADLETPVSAFLKLRAMGDANAFLLESVAGGENLARYSYLATNPSRVLSSKGREVTLRDAQGEHRSELPAGQDAPHVLSQLLKEYQFVPLPGWERFPGGAVGPVQKSEEFSPIGRPWYIGAIERGESGWTDLYIDFVSGSLVVTPYTCLLYTSPSPRDRTRSRMPSSA